VLEVEQHARVPITAGRGRWVAAGADDLLLHLPPVTVASAGGGGRTARAAATTSPAPSQKATRSKKWTPCSTKMPPLISRSQNQWPGARPSSAASLMNSPCTRSPSSRERITARTASASGLYRSTRFATQTSPRRAARAASVSASATVVASGFSTSTCLPASSAARDWRKWSAGGVAM
jgi:hypothetical protein